MSERKIHEYDEFEALQDYGGNRQKIARAAAILKIANTVEIRANDSLRRVLRAVGGLADVYDCDVGFLTEADSGTAGISLDPQWSDDELDTLLGDLRTHITDAVESWVQKSLTQTCEPPAEAGEFLGSLEEEWEKGENGGEAEVVGTGPCPVRIEGSHGEPRVTLRTRWQRGREPLRDYLREALDTYLRLWHRGPVPGEGDVFRAFIWSENDAGGSMIHEFEIHEVETEHTFHLGEVVE